jgi:hypothetical protein
LFFAKQAGIDAGTAKCSIAAVNLLQWGKDFKPSESVNLNLDAQAPSGRKINKVKEDTHGVAKIK